MRSKKVLDLTLRQLALEDPIKFGAVGDTSPGDREPAIVMLIREVIDEAAGVVGKRASREKLLEHAWFLLARQNEILNRVANMLWGASVGTAPQRSPLMSTLAQEDVDEVMQNYVVALKAMSALVEPVRLNRLRLPVTNTVVAELEYLPPVFEFLAARRSKLRQLVHAQHRNNALLGCQYSGADRADETLGMYHTLILGYQLPESVENWTFRDKPDLLQQNMRDLLSDMMHLAKAEGIDWQQLLQDAQESNEQEIADEG